MTFDHTTLVKNDSNNKMMDIINTECFSIVDQKMVNVRVSNVTSRVQNLVGVPGNTVSVGIGTRLVTMWIPGRKFGQLHLLVFHHTDTHM